MMMSNSLKNLCRIEPGTVITGKWHQQSYVVIKLLGSGANGVVYLVRFQNKKAALKLSDNGMNITSEVNVLKSFAKVQGSSLGPSLIDVDDWVMRHRNISFYVMEFIDGPQFLSFTTQRNHDWMSVLILQLLGDLALLHEKGWVFGDLKPDNLIVMGPPPRIRCIDVGGTTRQGRAIKEFTEFFDRGYWGLGSRRAEASYDLFAVAMIMINTEYPHRFSKKNGGIEELKRYIFEKPLLQKYDEIILKALLGKYSTARKMRLELLEVMDDVHRYTNSVQSQRHRKMKRTRTHRNTARRKNAGGWKETIMIILTVSILYFIYIFSVIN